MPPSTPAARPVPVAAARATAVPTLAVPAPADPIPAGAPAILVPTPAPRPTGGGAPAAPAKAGAVPARRAPGCPTAGAPLRRGAPVRAGWRCAASPGAEAPRGGRAPGQPAGWRRALASAARCLAALAALGLAAPAAGQGFAGMGADAPGFALPERGHRLEFPRDHGAHPDFRIEWWYLTANLEGPDGTPFGVQWTLFRFGLAPETAEGWASPQGWMAHAGLTTPTAHHAAERFARDGVGQAGVTAEPFHAWLDDWEMRSTAVAGADALDRLRITARGADFAFALEAEATGPLVLHGAEGFSQKSAGGQASYYYSQPFYRVTGTLRLPEAAPVPVTGLGWLDREWSSRPLAGEAAGWDWFAMHFDDGDKLMIARIRSEADGATGFAAATWIGADGGTETFGPEAPRFTPLGTARVAGRDVPVHWRVELPARGLDVEVTAINPDAWMDTAFPYWEGPVRIAGTHPGRGYLEMTGY